MIHCDYNQEAWLQGIFGTATGYAIDVGANDGSFLSNTKLLEQAGWRVLCVEANPDYSAELKRTRKESEICACSDHDAFEADFFVNESYAPSGSSLIQPSTGKHKTVSVPVRTANRLLIEHGFPSLDLASVDVEGTELDVLRGLNLDKWKPKAVLVEILGEAFIGDRALQVLADTIDFMSEHGYRMDERLGTDTGFLRSA